MKAGTEGDGGTARQNAPRHDGAPRRWAFARTTAFRVTLLHLALTLAGTLALSGLAWWAIVGYAARQAAQQVERDVGLLLQSAALSGLRGVALSVEARLAADRSGSEYYLLAGPEGERIAGNLAEAPRFLGWRTLRVARGVTEDAAAAAVPVLAFGAPLADGAFLVAGRDLSPVEALEDRLLGAAGWVVAGALLLGLFGGLLMARGVARRAAAMGEALAAVEAGDMARRLPVRPGGDEFDRLAARINAALDRAQALMATLRQVTDDIAHDLRTPLSRLRQRLEAAGRARSAPEWQAEAEAATAECDRILEIFASLLRIAEIESGARRAAFARFDLSAVLEAVAEVYAPAAEERRQRLTTAITPGLAAFGDRALVTQMAANLVENAVRHGREGGRVDLALSPAAPDGGGGGGGAVLTVTDDGPGIPAEERERVFRRFHRLDAARATPGSGLGLALVGAVAGLHGAAITLSDAAPGLRVTITFPARPADSPAAAPAAPAAP